MGECLLFLPIMRYASVLKFLIYHAQYHVLVKDLCLKYDCFIRVYLLV